MTSYRLCPSVAVVAQVSLHEYADINIHHHQHKRAIANDKCDYVLYVIVFLDSASGRDLSGCKCPPRCINVRYKATISSSRLSEMMISSYMSSKNNNTELGRRYVNAVETRNRVASSLLSDVVGHLEKLVTAYQRLKAVLAVDLLQHTTSVPGQIHESINTIVQQTQNHLAEFSSQIVDKFSDYYEENTDILVTQAIASSKSILSFQFFASLNLSDADRFDVNRIEKIFDYKDAFCNSLKSVAAHINRGANFSTKLFVDRTCFYLDTGNCCPISFEPSMINNTNYIEQLVELCEPLVEAARTLVRCVPMYRTFLNEVQSWLKLALELNSSLPLQPEDRRYALTDLERELNWVKSISRTVAEESMVTSFFCTKLNKLENVIYTVNRKKHTKRPMFLS